jgi:flagellar FliJ protein
MATKFRFRLEFLIKLRARREEEAKLRLAQRLASIRELLEEIETTEVLRARLTAELTEKMRAGRLEVALLKLYRDYDHKQVKDLGRLNEFLHLSRREEAKERAALIKASVDRKIMEKLKEKKEAEFMALQTALEEKEMEELSSMTRARRSRVERGHDVPKDRL